MLKVAAVIALVGLLALSLPSKPASTGGTWQVDTRHSDAQLKTDATTDFGKTKMDVTLGFARVRGRVILDDADPTKSSVNLSIYPAGSMTPAIDEDGKFLSTWLANLSNHTLVCFHSKNVVRTPDGRLQATGDLVLTRVDRNVELTPSEAYAGPVYGPPMVHRIVREATFVFNLPGQTKGQNDGELLASGSTNLHREDFPQLVKAVLTTSWPPVVQDKNCPELPPAGEDYHGSQCTGTVLEPPALPQAPSATNGEDYPGSSNFNSLTGNRLAILVHLHLAPRSSAAMAAGGY